jgi:hypothetical protein
MCIYFHAIIAEETTRKPWRGKMSNYFFDGDKIKITAKDFALLQKRYPNLDLVAELEQLDLELREDKKWWGVMNAKLNYRNKNAQKRTRTTLAHDLTDKSWADNVVYISDKIK